MFLSDEINNQPERFRRIPLFIFVAFHFSMMSLGNPADRLVSTETFILLFDESHSPKKKGLHKWSHISFFITNWIQLDGFCGVFNTTGRAREGIILIGRCIHAIAGHDWACIFPAN